MQYIKSAFLRFRDFKGVSNRKEFWIFFIIAFIIIHLFTIPGWALVVSQTITDLKMLQSGKTTLPLSHTAPIGVLFCAIGTLLMLIFLIPFVSLTCRRLRDAGFSPIWTVLFFVPIIGSIIFLIMVAQKSKHHTTLK